MTEPRGAATAKTIAIRPLDHPLRAVVRVPGSKSFTNRALPIAAFARGHSTLRNALDSDDTRAMLGALRELGIRWTHDAAARTISVDGAGGALPMAKARLDLANSGTSIRFLAALLAAVPGSYVLDGNARMRERPIGDLLAALESLGARAQSLRGNGCPPIEVIGGAIRADAVRVRGDVSSQFLSGLLMMAPLADRPLEIAVDGALVSEPYVEMTLATMAAFGAKVVRAGQGIFRFDAPAGYVACDYAIEPDASSASYFFAAAAIGGGETTVEGLGTASMQGDLAFVRLLERMGCRVAMSATRTSVARGADLVGIDVDMRDISDTAMTLAAVACFAVGKTRIRNVAHIRNKETDRIAALAAELRKAGVGITEFADGLEIAPAALRPAIFETYDDHRMAMSLALLGLRQPGIIVRDPACTAKTYPDFWRDLSAL